jgi:hypothetical protein
MVLLYQKDESKYAAIGRYLSEGLSRGQLCVYGSISMRDSEHEAKILARLPGGGEHKKNGNLLFIDMAPIYIAAMCGDLGPFRQARDQLVEMVKNRADKHIRFVGDCAGFLFKNKHFEECLMVEGWGQQKPFLGSYLCPYHSDLMDKHPYDRHSTSILSVKHDLAVDAEVIEEANRDVARYEIESHDSHSNRKEGNE